MIRRSWVRLTLALLLKSAAVMAVLGVAWLLGAAQDPLPDLKAGVAAYEAKRYPGAIASLSLIHI